MIFINENHGFPDTLSVEVLADEVLSEEADEVVVEDADEAVPVVVDVAGVRASKE